MQGIQILFPVYSTHRFLKRNKLLWWQYYENDYIYLSTTGSILISKDPPVISMAIRGLPLKSWL